MTVDPYKAPTPSADKKIEMPGDNDEIHQKNLIKSHRLLKSTAFLYPILLSLILIVGTTLLIVTITRRNTCRQLKEERIFNPLGLVSYDHTNPWVPCVKTSKTSACVCPASFIHSKVHSSHCIPSHSRCLQSCIHNLHCACYNLNDANRCRVVTGQWIEKEIQIGNVEKVHHLNKKSLLQYPWTDHLNHQIEHLLVNTKSGERLFFSSDRKTGITIHEQDDDYLLNERWTKIEPNTTEQHVVYTQLDPQTHTCRMSSLKTNGSVTHGPAHTCPGATIGAPYFVGVACHDILVLWHGGKQSKIRQQDEWTVSHHHFESVKPRLHVLLDPFHRYYSLYDDLMIEIKDLNGDVLGQIFTDIHMPTKFEFIDQYATILIANHTHMQLISSRNEQAWLDF